MFLCINHGIIFHTNHWKPTLVHPPCIVQFQVSVKFYCQINSTSTWLCSFPSSFIPSSPPSFLSSSLSVSETADACHLGSFPQWRTEAGRHADRREHRRVGRGHVHALLCPSLQLRRWDLCKRTGRGSARPAQCPPPAREARSLSLHIHFRFSNRPSVARPLLKPRRCTLGNSFLFLMAQN